MQTRVEGIPTTIRKPLKGVKRLPEAVADAFGRRSSKGTPMTFYVPHDPAVRRSWLAMQLLLMVLLNSWCILGTTLLLADQHSVFDHRAVLVGFMLIIVIMSRMLWVKTSDPQHRILVFTFYKLCFMIPASISIGAAALTFASASGAQLAVYLGIVCGIGVVVGLTCVNLFNPRDLCNWISITILLLFVSAIMYKLLLAGAPIVQFLNPLIQQLVYNSSILSIELFNSIGLGFMITLLNSTAVVILLKKGAQKYPLIKNLVQAVK